MEAVGQSIPEVAGDAALSGSVAGGGTVTERGPGGGPGGEAGAFEVLQHGAGRRSVGRGVVGGEGGAVEVADEVLATGPAGDAARVEVDHHHPLDVARVAVHGQREQVGALPGAADGSRGAELTQVGPVLQVR